MWVLSCEGELFGGKKLWLRPGSTHLLGRTRGRPEGGERNQYIEHKSVSRKHLIISIGHVNSGNSGQLYSRTEVQVTDASKIGTTINGDKITKETLALDPKQDYTIKLGSYEPLFRLEWRSVVLSLTNLGKSSKSKGSVLSEYQEKLEGVDVKLATTYVANETTHVIAKKRNTPIVLQAIVQARWVVTEGFVDALADASRRMGIDANGDPAISLLEQDFDSYWPKEERFLVPAGAEPVQRDEGYLKPRPERSDVFHDYVFVFLAQSQYDNLLPIITSGGGKALIWNYESGQSRVEDCVGYVREIAGDRDNSRFRLSQQTGNGGIIIVRMSEERSEAKSFISGLDQVLGQRSIEQNELLDAILTIDASELRKALPESQTANREDPSAEDVPGPALRNRQPQEQLQIQQSDVPSSQLEAQERPQQSTEEGQAEQPLAAARRRNRRMITQSRFKGFDDFDPSQFTRPASESPEPSVRLEPSQASQAPSGQNMEIDDPQEPIDRQRNSGGIKRPAPTDDNQANDEVDCYAGLLPGQAALKRRRTEAIQRGEKSGFATQLTDSERIPTEATTARPKKKEKQVDVKAELRVRREREEEQRRKDEEALQEGLEGIDINEVRKLIKVEEIDLPARQRPSRRNDESVHNERWDPMWNGRKNFKKFRPQGQQHEGPRLSRVIVTLEAVPRKGHGIGDEHWLTPTSQSGRSKSKSQSQSQSVRAAAADASNEDEADDGLSFRRRLQISREEDVEEAAAENIDDDEIAGRPRNPSLFLGTLNGTPSQTFGTESQRQAKAAGKRRVPHQVGSGPPAKKARQSRFTTQSRINLDDDDDDDGLKFRRRKR